MTEEQAQAAVDASKAAIAAKVAELQASGYEPPPTDFTSPETIASIGEGDIYDTHYGVNRPVGNAANAACSAAACSAANLAASSLARLSLLLRLLLLLLLAKPEKRSCIS